MFNKSFAMELRNNGLSNREISLRMGKSYQTVLNHIGKQPQFMTTNNKNLGRRIAHEKRIMVKTNALQMKQIGLITNQIIELKTKQDMLTKGII